MAEISCFQRQKNSKNKALSRVDIEF